MKKAALLLALTAVTFAAASASAASPKTYQVTGPVIAMDDSTITVQKGSEKWEIAKGSVSVPSDVQVGSKVMIMYSMTAASIESKNKPMTKASSSGAKPTAASPAIQH